MQEYKIQKVEENIRIDKIVGELQKDISRTAIQRMIEEGNIIVNNNKIKSSYKVVEGDLVTIKKQEPIEIDLVAQDIPLDIIYEDDDILIVNKQKGMVVHPGARKSG